MIPNIFVSSTVEDLRHFREAMRDELAELGYSPILSEHGDVGFPPTTSAEEACYRTVEQCQLLILIISKRYGHRAADGLSITHREFHAAREARIPVITLVEKDVLSFKAVYDVNRDAPPQFPGMDMPEGTFALVEEIASASVNNAILGYVTVAEARSHLRRQLAHMFGELLRSAGGGTFATLREILAEVKTLRHESTPSPNDILRGSSSALAFFRVMKHLLLTENTALGGLLRAIFQDEVERAVPAILAHATLQSFLHAVGWTIDEGDADIVELQPLMQSGDLVLFSGTHKGPFYMTRSDRRVVVASSATADFLNEQFLKAKASATQSAGTGFGAP